MKADVYYLTNSSNYYLGFFITAQKDSKPYHFRRDGTWELEMCFDYFATALEAAALFQKFYPKLKLTPISHEELTKLEWEYRK